MIRTLLTPLTFVFLIGCSPPECTSEAPEQLAAIPALELSPETSSLSLSAKGSCPVFELSDVSGEMGGAQLLPAANGGPDWIPAPLYRPLGGGSSDGRCECAKARMTTLRPGDAISTRRFEVSLTQGSTRIEASYEDVSNSIRVVEKMPDNLPPHARAFDFVSEFDRPYFSDALVTDRFNNRPVRRPAVIDVVARNQGVKVPVRVLKSSPLLVLEVLDPTDEITFEVVGLFHDIQPSRCVGPATCAPLRVISPQRFVKF